MLSKELSEQRLFSITLISNLLSPTFIPVDVLRGRQRCWGKWGKWDEGAGELTPHGHGGNGMRELGN